MKFIKLSVLFFVSILCIALIATQFSNESAVKTYVSKNVCLSALDGLVTKPSSTEINSINIFDSNIPLNEALDTIKNKGYSKDLTKSLIEKTERNYADKNYNQKIYISFDYSSEEQFIGVSRSNFICVFTSDIFGHHRLHSITYKNKDYFHLQDIFLFKEQPKRLNSIWQVEDENFLDRIKYSISKFLPDSET